MGEFERAMSALAAGFLYGVALGSLVCFGAVQHGAGHEAALLLPGVGGMFAPPAALAWWRVLAEVPRG